MRFSAIVAGLIATVCTRVLAAPAFPPVGVGVLPSQPTTAEDVTRDMTNLETSLGNFNKAVQDATAGGTAIDGALSGAIEYQAITQTARLNTQNILALFTPDDSAAVVDKLKTLSSDLQDTKTLLANAKAGGLLDSYQGTVIELYLELVSSDTAGYVNTLLPYIDATVKDAATADADAINDSLGGIGNILATK